jgi:hypothetical protein
VDLVETVNLDQLVPMDLKVFKVLKASKDLEVSVVT